MSDPQAELRVRSSTPSLPSENAEVLKVPTYLRYLITLSRLFRFRSIRRL